MCRNTVLCLESPVKLDFRVSYYSVVSEISGQIGFPCVTLQCNVWNLYWYGQIGFSCVALQCCVWNLYWYGQIGCGVLRSIKYSFCTLYPREYIEI